MPRALKFTVSQKVTNHKPTQIETNRNSAHSFEHPEAKMIRCQNC